MLKAQMLVCNCFGNFRADLVYMRLGAPKIEKPGTFAPLTLMKFYAVSQFGKRYSFVFRGRLF